MAVTLSTDDRRSQERFAYWRELICDTFVQLDCERAEAENFGGILVNREAGPLQITDVRSEPQHVIRSRRQIAKGHEDYYLISLQMTGRGQVRQDGRTADLEPGDFALYDSTRPYDLYFDGSFSQLVLQMRRSVLRDRLVAPETCTARRISGEAGAGALVSGFLVNFAQQAERLETEAGGRLAANAVDMLATAFAAQSGEGRAALAGETPAVVATLYRIKTFMEARLGDPDLNAGAVAEAHGMTVRHLSRLFATEGTTPMRWLWRRRMERCRADLSDPLMSHRTITEIAYANGFSDASHFSHAFRRRYGMSPRECRAR